MIVEQILGNIFAPPDALTPLAQDDLDLDWHECNLRAMRRRSRSGREIAILLPLGVGLRHGDILLEESDLRVVVNLLPCRVIVLRPADVQEMGVLACELGNLHVPVEVMKTELIVLNEGPTMGVIRQYNVPFEIQTRRFSPIRASVLTRPRLSDALTTARASKP